MRDFSLVELKEVSRADSKEISRAAMMVAMMVVMMEVKMVALKAGHLVVTMELVMRLSLRNNRLKG